MKFVVRKNGADIIKFDTDAMAKQFIQEQLRHGETGLTVHHTEDFQEQQFETWNRFDKLDFLLETTGEEFKSNLLDKIVASMSEKEFAETYDFICRTEGIARDYDELKQLEQENAVFEPQIH